MAKTAIAILWMRKVEESAFSAILVTLSLLLSFRFAGFPFDTSPVLLMEAKYSFVPGRDSQNMVLGFRLAKIQGRGCKGVSTWSAA